MPVLIPGRAGAATLSGFREELLRAGGVGAGDRPRRGFGNREAMPPLKVGESRGCARRPTGLHLANEILVTEAEVLDRALLGEVRRPGSDDAGLPSVAGAEPNLRADRVAVRDRTDELELDPMLEPAAVLQQLRRLLVVTQQEIGLAVV